MMVHSNILTDLDTMKITYSNIFIEDVEDALIQYHFQKAYDFIDETLFGDSCGNQSKTDNEEIDIDSDKSQTIGDEKDTHTLKLNLSQANIGEWAYCEIKRASYQIDTKIFELFNKNSTNKILVHCAMGKSRSASIVTMYLMKKFLLSFKTSKKVVETRRETVEINSGFLSELNSFEKNNYKFFTENTDDEDGNSTEGEESLISDLSKLSVI
jgi:hypothetical protein